MMAYYDVHVGLDSLKSKQLQITNARVFGMTACHKWSILRFIGSHQFAFEVTVDLKTIKKFGMVTFWRDIRYIIITISL